MEVDSADFPGDLAEADVVEALEAGTGNGADRMIRDEEVFLPSHEKILALGEVLVCEIGALGLFCERPPCGEATPVLHVDLLVRAPFRPVGLESVFRADDLAFEIRREGRVVIR